MTLDVLVVCTGNLCRSPAAELLLRDRLRGLPVAVHSAGTSGVSGYGIDASTAYAVSEFGLDPAAHVARRLTPVMVRMADLVLTAETSHRSVVVQSEPLAFRRTFTLREFARLGAELEPLPEIPTPDRLRERIAAVAARRGLAGVGEPGGDDIGDPMGAGLEVARSTLAVIDEAVAGIVQSLGLGPYVDAPARSTHQPATSRPVS